ncbi:hypothetical protein CTAYLR_004156 [Chrysophaeum taylorii]|uniref:MRH domain-containing protein n=1 Tax=Chrysophaeum taylorii TaxID=2483200 RepID=A0AAD7XM76_9STRA|nr:hypothetical protein CTAYLR_004156 [Chrysophaeum taylorii]
MRLFRVVVVPWAALAAAVHRGLEEPAGSQQQARVVRVFNTIRGGGGLEITDAAGRAYSCRVGTPPPDASSEYDDRNGTLPSIRSVEAYLRYRGSRSHCIESPKRHGYWSYELCAGARARQFRRRDNGDGESHSLGRFDGTAVARDSTLATPEELAALFPGVAGSTLADGVVLAPEAMRGALVERYADGDGDRSAVAYVACLLAETEPARKHKRAAPETKIYEELRVARVVEQPLHSYHLLVAAPHMCAREDLAHLALRRELTHLHGRCLRRKAQGDWWTYELCVGDTLRQFRASKDKAASDQQFIIGRFDTEDTGTTSATHLYARGDVCDLTGTTRSARVHFQCAPTSHAALLDTATNRGPAVVAVVETATCEYDITVNLPAVCAIFDRDDLGASGSTSIRHIDCAPVLGPTTSGDKASDASSSSSSSSSS